MSVSDVDEGDGVEGPAHNRLTCGITIWPMVSSSRNDWRQDSGRKQILFNQFYSGGFGSKSTTECKTLNLIQRKALTSGSRFDVLKWSNELVVSWFGVSSNRIDTRGG